MSTAPQIGTIASKTDKLLVQRQGEQLTLRQGDAILAGDVLQNKDLVAVDIELPGQAAGQADSLVTLAPESAAQIATNSAAEGGIGRRRHPPAAPSAARRRRLREAPPRLLPLRRCAPAEL